MNNRIKIIRATTVPMSLDAFCNGMLKELSEKYEVVALSSPGEEMKAVAEREGVRTIEVPMERHISLKHDLVSLWRMIKVFRREKPTMVHSMTPKAGLLCMMAAWLTRVPVRVHTFTGLVWPTESGLKRRILMMTDWLTCACATHIIPEGEGVKNDLLEGKITKKPMKVLGYGNVRGIDMELFSFENLKLRIENYPTDTKGHLKRILSKDDNTLFTFLFVGRIVGDKGINELVAAFKRLNEEYKDTRLLLVGWQERGLDPLSEDTQKIIDGHNCIHAVGTKEGDELLAYYASADCFVMPSYREGFPNTVLEAGAMGLPCIVTDINGSREIIINENHNERHNVNSNLQIRDNGIVIPSKDDKALYEAMKRMLTDTEMRQRMAGNARRMIAERFDQNYVRQCLLDFYDEIMA